ncbi:hypothetical protein, partial [Neisseria oralis]|uniref:hypothetical protein n=1 Tax=Neisseria oralis TaxID=1107316 RepID=UPI0027E59EA2
LKTDFRFQTAFFRVHIAKTPNCLMRCLPTVVIPTSAHAQQVRTNHLNLFLLKTFCKTIFRGTNIKTASDVTFKDCMKS